MFFDLEHTQTENPCNFCIDVASLIGTLRELAPVGGGEGSKSFRNSDTLGKCHRFSGEFARNHRVPRRGGVWMPTI